MRDYIDLNFKLDTPEDMFKFRQFMCAHLFVATEGIFMLGSDKLEQSGFSEPDSVMEKAYGEYMPALLDYIFAYLEYILAHNDQWWR